jgi:hypothetical protein
VCVCLRLFVHIPLLFLGGSWAIILPWQRMHMEQSRVVGWMFCFICRLCCIGGKWMINPFQNVFFSSPEILFPRFTHIYFLPCLCFYFSWVSHFTGFSPTQFVTLHFSLFHLLPHTNQFLVYFQYFEKIKVNWRDHCAVCVPTCFHVPTFKCLKQSIWNLTWAHLNST